MALSPGKQQKSAPGLQAGSPPQSASSQSMSPSPSLSIVSVQLVSPAPARGVDLAYSIALPEDWGVRVR